MKKRITKISLFLAVLILAVVFVGKISVAAAPQAVSGWAWSDNIGWISFNSQNAQAVSTVPFGVTLSDTKVFSGYAWSDNIGWVKFDPAFTGPSGAADRFGAKFVGNDVKGWARACSGMSNPVTCTDPVVNTPPPASPSPSRPYHLNSIASSADGTKLAIVNSNGITGGYIYTSTDSGATFVERLGSGARYWDKIVSSSDGMKLLATTILNSSNDPATADGVYISIDGGVTWNKQIGLGDHPWTSAASSADGSKLFVVDYKRIGGNGESMFYSFDSGATWNTSNSTIRWLGRFNIMRKNGIASSADGNKLAAIDVILADDSGRIFTSTNSGITWNQTSAPQIEWTGISSSPDGTKLVAWGVSNSTTISPPPAYVYTSSDSGVTWIRRTTPGGTNVTPLVHIVMSSDGTKLAAVAGWRLYISSDSGVTWVEAPNSQPGDGTTGSYTDVAISADGTNVFALASYGYIYTTALGLILPTITLPPPPPPPTPATGAAAGWDGWIGFSGLGANGVHLGANGKDITGYAWGSNVVGWVAFNLSIGTTAPATSITPTILANDKTGLTGNRFFPTDNITLSWNSVGDPADCKEYNESSGSKVLVGSPFTSGDSFNGTLSLGAKPAGTSLKYSITCTKPGVPDGTAVVAFNVVAPLSATCSVSPSAVDLVSNGSVTWTGVISGGVAPFTYLWNGDAPLNGKTTNPVTVTYPNDTTLGFKSGQITVSDSSDPPQSVSQKNCSNGVTVTDTRCDFALSVNPSNLKLSFVGNAAATASTNVKVLATNCTSPVTITVPPYIPPVPPVAPPPITGVTIIPDPNNPLDPPIVIVTGGPTGGTSKTVDIPGGLPPDVTITPNVNPALPPTIVVNNPNLPNLVVIVVELKDPVTGQPITQLNPANFLAGVNLVLTVNKPIPAGIPITLPVVAVGTTIDIITGLPVALNRNINIKINSVIIKPTFDEI